MRRSLLPCRVLKFADPGPGHIILVLKSHEIRIIRHLRGALKNPSKTPDDMSTKAHLSDSGVRIVVEAVALGRLHMSKNGN